MLELLPAVADQPARPQTSAELIAYWLENVRHRPAESVIGRVGKSIKAMLAEGIDPDHIADALPLWVDRGLDPSVLPSVVNQVQNAAPAGHRPSTTDRAVAAGDIALAEFRRMTGRSA